VAIRHFINKVKLLIGNKAPVFKGYFIALKIKKLSIKNLSQKTIIVFCFLIFNLAISSFAFGQKVKPIQNALDKNDFDKALKKIGKNLRKDSLDAGTYYLYSMYYVHPKNYQNYHLDSAYKYVLKALRIYEQRDGKYRYQLAEDGIRVNEIQFQKNFIDSTAYNIADSLGELESYQYFLNNYRSESYTPLATAKRDSLAYLLAKKQDTYQAYFKFISRYPSSAQYQEAKKKYHDLLYKVKTERDDLASLESFISKYPESPYYERAQLRLFNIYTSDNEIPTYEKFISRYPNNVYTERAWHWIWYLQQEKENFLKIYPQFPDKNFVYNSLKSDTASYYPFYDDERAFYGYMDRFGNEIIPAGFKDIPEDYLCEGVVKDFIIGYKNKKAGAVNLLGQQIVPFDFQEISEFTSGVLKTKKNGRYGLVHKTGFEIVPAIYNSLTPLRNRLIKYSVNKSGLLSYSGRVITQSKFDDILAIGENFVAFEQQGKFSIHSKESVLQETANYEFIYDDFELIDDRFLLLEQNNQYKLYDIVENKNLFERAQDILETDNGWLVMTNGKFQIFNKDGFATSPLLFEEVIQNQRAFGVKTSGKWGVADAQGKLFLQPVYDTLFFVGNKGILLYEADKKWGYFFTDELTDLSKYDQLNIQLVEYKDENNVSREKAFVVTKDRRGFLGVLDTSGKTIISNRYNKINAVNSNLLIIERYGKKGIINVEGKSVVGLKYEGIVSKENGFALLSNKKFGLYSPIKDAIIDADYDMLLQPYGETDSIFIAKKGAYGLIDVNSQVLVDFQFEDLEYWTDEVALVKHQSKWKLYDLKNKYFIPEVFDTFERLKEEKEETIIMTYRSSGYGVLSSKYGRIIPEEYSNIFNMGSQDRPLYFVERDVAQAGLYILLYIDEKGNVIKKQVLKEEDYNKIACSDN